MLTVATAVESAPSLDVWWPAGQGRSLVGPLMGEGDRPHKSIISHCSYQQNGWPGNRFTYLINLRLEL